MLYPSCLLCLLTCVLQLFAFSLPSSSFRFKKTASMAPKKPWAILSNPRTNDIRLPPLEATWTRHPVPRAPIEAEVLTECRGSVRGVQNFQNFFRDNNDSLGVTIPLRLVVRMRVERSEIPFGFVRFESKARRQADFGKGLTTSWVRQIWGHS